MQTDTCHFCGSTRTSELEKIQLLRLSSSNYSSITYCKLLFYVEARLFLLSIDDNLRFVGNCMMFSVESFSVSIYGRIDCIHSRDTILSPMDSTSVLSGDIGYAFSLTNLNYFHTNYLNCKCGNGCLILRTTVTQTKFKLNWERDVHILWGCIW